MIERYTLPEIGKLWSEESKFSIWLEVEVAACVAMSELGLIPQEAANVIKRRAGFDIARIAEIEATTNHDMIAFLTAVGEKVGPEAKYIHYGMTSSDVLDTALSLQLVRAAKFIDSRIAEALKILHRMASKYARTPIIGRTHGVMAEPTTIGLKLAVWYTELARGRKRFGQATEGMRVGAISGAVGNFANIDPRIESLVCKKLGLAPAAASTQVLQRDRHAAYVNALALLFSSIEKFATEIRNLQRTEIGEMQEGFAKGQKGSSAMPHKRNPITAERLTGIARLLRGYAVSAMENVPLWHERDIAHSSVERVIMPDATILADYGLAKFNDLLRGLILNTRRMRENIDFKGGIVFSQRLLLALTDKIGDRNAAYTITQRNAMAAHDGKAGFRDLILRDPEVTRRLNKREIEEIFDVSYYLKHAESVVKRALREI